MPHQHRGQRGVTTPPGHTDDRPRSPLRDRLAAARLVVVVRGTDDDAVERSVRTLAGAGVGLVEVSLTSARALDVIARLAGDGLGVGVGTVRVAAEAEAAVDAGAAFAVTPGLGPGARRCLELGLPTIVGALTPTEVERAHVTGADAVKLFPAALHGPSYVRMLRGPYPDVPLMAVGGVDAAVAPDYLAAGAVAVGIGGALLRDAADGGDQSALAERARELIRALVR